MTIELCACVCMCSGQTRRCAALAEEKQVKSGQTKASSLARVKRTSTRAPKDSDFSLVGPIEPHFVLREELTDSICAISVQRERGSEAFVDDATRSLGDTCRALENEILQILSRTLLSSSPLILDWIEISL